VRARLTGTSALASGLLAGALALLLVRIVPDVGGKPLFEDEAVSGLVSSRPAREILGTVLWDRGGSPLHFLLVHLAFVAHASPGVLRSLSVVFAVGTVVVTFDLGRRLAGSLAGGLSALVVGGSAMLAVYGSFGRMYSLFALAGALAGDALVRALAERSTRSAWLAVGAGWLLPAVHPYGGIVLAVEVLVLLVALRRRAVVPVAGLALAAAPFAVADLRLAHRFRVGAAHGQRVASPHAAWDQLAGAVQGFAGGRGVALAAALALVGVGVVALRRRRPAFVGFALVALCAPPLLALVASRGGDAPDLSPRHLAFALPLWAALAGAGGAWLAARRRGLAPVVAAGVVALVLLAPQATRDPRSLTFAAPLGGPARTAAPVAWLRARVGSGDVLFPYSSVFLAALPETGAALALPRAEPGPVADTLRRVALPVRRIFVSVPLGPSRVDTATLGRALGPRASVRAFDGWLLVEAEGPFAQRAEVLARLRRIVGAVEPALRGYTPRPVTGWLALERRVLREAAST
jgi:hypothetical protein